MPCTLFSDNGAVQNKNKVKVKDDITQVGNGIYRIEVSYKDGGFEATRILCDPRWANES
jgi:hypothetical protein